MSLPSSRKGRKGWVFFVGILVVLSFFGRWTGIFERKMVEPPSRKIIDFLPPPCIFQGKLNKNESLYLSLLKKGVSHRLIYQLTSTLRGKFDLRRSLPGDSYTLITTSDSVLFFEYQKGMRERCRVVRQDGRLNATVEPLRFNCMVRSLQGEIKSSLWESMIDECESPELIMKFTEIFEWEIDFLTEPRNGDKFRLVFEEYYKDGTFVKYGNILAAEYISGNQVHRAVLYSLRMDEGDISIPAGSR